MDGNGSAPSPPRPLLAMPSREDAPAISPDGRWIAYVAGDPSSGRSDVFVARFPEATGRVQVSSQGRFRPMRSPRGDELFYPAPVGVLQRVPVTIQGDRLQVGRPTALFEARDVDSMAASLDGSRFLAVKQVAIEPSRQLVVAQTRFGELGRQVAPLKQVEAVARPSPTQAARRSATVSVGPVCHPGHHIEQPETRAKVCGGSPGSDDRLKRT